MNYDVFISCKSEDYQYAEEIYNFLKESGITVFLASTELRRLGESEYRKAISSALKAAHHMIVFASKPEYIDARWVYYEWDMFVNAKLKGFKPGNIVTILKDVDTKEINMDLWKYESLRFDDYKKSLVSYVETPESKQRLEQIKIAQKEEAEKQRQEQARIEKQLKIKRELVALAEDYKKKLTNLSVDIAKIKDKRREAENITYRCPVCSEESSISDEYCNNCGWVFSPIEGIEGAEYLTKDRNPLVERMREIRAGKTDDSKQIKSLNTQIDNLKQELSSSRRDNGALSKQVVHLSDELSKLRKSQQSGQNQGGYTQSSSSFSLKNLFSWLKSNSLALIIIAISAVTFILLDKHASPEDFDCTAIDSVASDSVEADDSHAYCIIVDTAVWAEEAMLIEAELQQLIDGMVMVEGGTFTMGATSEQGSDADSDETPTHQVTLSDYMIGKTEVTQEQWEAVMGSNPSYYKGTNLPVEQVSWNECQEFIEKLNSLTGLNFRLPTEAEWEYAARGGAKSCGFKYSGSNDINDVAWYEINSYKTQTVATRRANELGLYDMSGNVWEWCSDWYGDYSSSHQTNPKGPSTGSDRVSRGGSWLNYAGFCRVSDRTHDNPSFSHPDLGFRLAL